MRKFLIMALTVLAISFASCNRGGNTSDVVEDTLTTDTIVADSIEGVDTLTVDTLPTTEDATL